MDASLIADLKDMAEQNRRLKKMYAEMSMQNDLLKEALKKSAKAAHYRDVHCPAMSREGRRRNMAMNAVAQHRVSIALARRTFEISETCFAPVGLQLGASNHLHDQSAESLPPFILTGKPLTSD